MAFGDVAKKVILPRLLLCFVLFLLVVMGFNFYVSTTFEGPAIGYGRLAFLFLVSVLACLGLPRMPYSWAILVASTGLLIIWFNHLLNLIYGYDWFEGHWYFTDDWIRYGVYALLGYVVTKMKGVDWANVSLAIAVFLDSILGWVVLLPTQLRELRVTTPDEEYVTIIRSYDWDDVVSQLQHLMLVGTLWWVIGLGGVLLASGWIGRFWRGRFAMDVAKRESRAVVE